MGVRKEIKIGQKFGRLTIIKEVAELHGRRVLCKCECGTEKEVKYSHLKGGLIISCGCWLKDHPAHKSHGLTGTREYSI